ncbi:hypothetical protein [Cytobacillus praedii]|uniref:Uncharacterized protein n=1 Tax=Cytobacillus praedii TaxID=1742358 RepID=A0A4R1AN01_9BACI|nr:hypothetical protein [Cytobacillus praedii]TCJ00991.1 hypothetical protein E0Y62_26240 [Cytobacillus praedii]
MTKMNREKVVYLVNADKKTPLIKFCSLPTKCSACHSFQEPQPISFKYHHKDKAIIVQFRCVNDKCKSLFNALYLKGSFGGEDFHYISFI